MSCLVFVILLVMSFGRSVDGDLPRGFPVNDCDCLVEFKNAERLTSLRGSESLIPIVLEAMAGIDGPTSSKLSEILQDPRVSPWIMQRSVFGIREDRRTAEFEWIAWIPIEKSEVVELIPALRPVREVDRLVIPKVDVSMARCGDGILLASEPPGSLRTQALAMIGAGSESLPWAGADAPLQITYRNDDVGTGLWFGQPGASRVLASDADGGVQVEYSGWSRDGRPVKPCCDRLLDLSVLEGMPKDLMGVFVELPDAKILPGTVFLENLLPYVVDSERSDERWSRRMVVLGEMAGGGEFMVPTLAVAIESDGPGSTLMRQDISVLAALNSLRNRLGSKAGLQHLPKLQELPESGTRTIYARAMFEPVLAGHPFLGDFSINWCRTDGETDWEIYATCPALTSQLSECFHALPTAARCVSASHVGRINTRKLSGHLEALDAMGSDFVSALDLDQIKSGMNTLQDLFKKTEMIDWQVTIPEDGRVDAVVTILPREESGRSDE